MEIQLSRHAQHSSMTPDPLLTTDGKVGRGGCVRAADRRNSGVTGTRWASGSAANRDSGKKTQCSPRMRRVRVADKRVAAYCLVLIGWHSEHAVDAEDKRFLAEQHKPRASAGSSDLRVLGCAWSGPRRNRGGESKISRMLYVRRNR